MRRARPAAGSFSFQTPDKESFDDFSPGRTDQGRSLLVTAIMDPIPKCMKTRLDII